MSFCCGHKVKDIKLVHRPYISDWVTLCDRTGIVLRGSLPIPERVPFNGPWNEEEAGTGKKRHIWVSLVLLWQLTQ